MLVGILDDVLPLHTSLIMLLQHSTDKVVACSPGPCTYCPHNRWQALPHQAVIDVGATFTAQVDSRNGTDLDVTPVVPGSWVLCTSDVGSDVSASRTSAPVTSVGKHNTTHNLTPRNNARLSLCFGGADNPSNWVVLSLAGEIRVQV